MPFGWFQIGYQDDFPVGAAVAVDGLGRNLVAWRDNGGRLHVADAFCPHLGAHLGYGGVVVDDGIRCPFHDWRFAADGGCVSAPYTDRTPAVRIRVYPVREIGPLAFFWFSDGGSAEPLWQLPSIPEVEATDVVRYRRIIKMRWEDVGENVIDLAHFPTIHRTGAILDFDVKDDGFFRVVNTKIGFPTDDTARSATVQTEHYGPGLFIVRLRGMANVTQVSTVTPIDDERIDLRYSYPSPDAIDDRERRVLTRLQIRDMMRQSDEDIAIWRHKIYLDRPVLARGDGPIHQWRRWAAQFAGDAASRTRRAPREAEPTRQSSSST